MDPPRYEVFYQAHEGAPTVQKGEFSTKKDAEDFIKSKYKQGGSGKWLLVWKVEDTPQ